jgi:hypothetical protein
MNYKNKTYHLENDNTFDSPKIKKIKLIHWKKATGGWQSKYFLNEMSKGISEVPR